jgi:phospholipid/cholesterol/gamma-HCH transport system ATP-binding protein
MTGPLIEFRKVRKGFGDRIILDQVDLSIYEGQTTTIIGKSGVGKSVTLKHIIGLLEPDGGEIRICDQPLKNMNRRERKAMKRQFSYMFQNNALFDSMTVFENIALPLVEKTTFSRDEIECRVLSKIDQLELSEVTHKYPSQISGGMQKRVALARALITEPRIVLFDEPTTGLDPIRKNAVLGMVAHYQKRFGFTSVIVSHDIPDVFFISNRIAILYDGKVIFQGSPFELEQFDHPVIEEFITSLRSLKDELTGLETRHSFERQYEHEFGPIHSMKAFTVILFSIENLSVVDDQLGPIATHKIVQSLASLIDKHLGVMGISTRYGPNEILSVLPHTDLDWARAFLEELAGELQSQEILNSQNYPEACLGFSFRVGLAEGKPGTELSTLVAQAKSGQTSLAELVCMQRSRGAV